MRKLVLIDHSLKNVGGHHYSYAREFISAARRAGFEPVLATHRRFRESAAFARDCVVLPIFRHASYSPLTFDMQAFRPGVRRAAPGAGLAAAWLKFRRTRRARAFANDCRALFARVGLAAGDSVFLATASEIDLTGLCAFLREGSIDPAVEWHVQFHFGIFQGRDPDYAGQSVAVETLRTVFRTALAHLGAVRLHCYSTTEALTDQYRRLDVAPFQTLPYPVNAELRIPVQRAASAEPVRIACLGHTRREKGLGALGGIITSLWNRYLRDGHAQLLVQTSRQGPRHDLTTRVALQGTHGATPPLVFAPFPLDLPDYVALVRSAGIGLLLYDSARYYARCSGVLLELLCSGVPVIVPAGCWLAEQIAESNQSYLEGLAASAQPVRGEANASEAQPFALDPLTLAYRADGERTLLLVRFRVSAGAGPGRYLHWELSQRDEAGALLPPSSLANTITGMRAQGSTWVAFALDPGARGLQLQVRNAWHREPTTLEMIECFAHSGARPPLAAVGLAIHEPVQAAPAVAELLAHYAHYREGALSLAARCARYHNADRLIAQLIGAAALEAEHLRPAAASGR